MREIWRSHFGDEPGILWVIWDPSRLAYYQGIDLPVQLWSSELGGGGGTAQSVARVMRWLPVKPDFHLVGHAEHWAFLAPCSADQVKSLPRICNDTPSFDRVAFHKEFNAAVLAFFSQELKARQAISR